MSEPGVAKRIELAVRPLYIHHYEGLTAYFISAPNYNRSSPSAASAKLSVSATVHEFDEGIDGKNSNDNSES